MGVRNCRDLGDNLQKITSRLMANQTLIKLLYFTERDALQKEFNQEFLQSLGYDSYKKFCEKEIFQKLIRVVPSVGPKENSTSIIVPQIIGGSRNPENGEFKDVAIAVEVFVPLTQWIIKDQNLRPFYILGEIQESLDGKTINGVGKMIGGDFEINFLTEEISCHRQEFQLVSYA